MSIAAVSSNGIDYTAQTNQSRLEQFRQGFQQLGQDLQAGNLSAAQQVFVALPKPGEASGSQQINSPIEQSFLQLRQNLLNGNLTGATQNYKEIQQDIQNRLAHRAEPVSGGQGPAEPVPVTPSIASGQGSSGISVTA